VPELFVMDKGSGHKFIRGAENSELVHFKAEGAPAPAADQEQDQTVMTIWPKQHLRLGNVEITADDVAVAKLLRDPSSVLGRAFYRRFYTPAPEHKFLKDFRGTVKSTYNKLGEGRRWRVLYEDGTEDDFTFEEIKHHVLDNYTSLPGVPKHLEYKRTPETAIASGVAHMMPHSPVLHGEVNPYARVPEAQINISARRDVVFLRAVVAEHAGGVLKVPYDMSAKKAYGMMPGLLEQHFELAYRWHGKTIGDKPRQVDADEAFTAKFNPFWRRERQRRSRKAPNCRYLKEHHGYSGSTNLIANALRRTRRTKHGSMLPACPWWLLPSRPTTPRASTTRWWTSSTAAATTS
jgi:hypothetical protein